MIQFDVRIFFIHGLKLNHQLVTYLFGKVGMEGMNEATLRRSSDLDGGRHGSSKVQSIIKTQILKSLPNALQTNPFKGTCSASDWSSQKISNHLESPGFKKTMMEKGLMLLDVPDGPLLLDGDAYLSFLVIRWGVAAALFVCAAAVYNKDLLSWLFYWLCF